MKKKYIYFYDPKVYAIYYRATKTLYYNMYFTAKTKLILFK